MGGTNTNARNRIQAQILPARSPWLTCVMCTIAPEFGNMVANSANTKASSRMAAAPIIHEKTLLLAIGGGVIGGVIAWVLFDNYTASTLGANFSQVVFEFRVTPALLAEGLKWALAIGFLGGLFPAVRAARMPVTEGLREL